MQRCLGHLWGLQFQMSHLGWRLGSITILSRFRLMKVLDTRVLSLKGDQIKSLKMIYKKDKRQPMQVRWRYKLPTSKFSLEDDHLWMIFWMRFMFDLQDIPLSPSRLDPFCKYAGLKICWRLLHMVQVRSEPGPLETVAVMISGTLNYPEKSTEHLLTLSSLDKYSSFCYAFCSQYWKAECD